MSAVRHLSNTARVMSGVLLIAATAALLATRPGSAVGASTPAEVKAHGLAASPSLNRSAGPSYDAIGPARAEATRAAGRVPFPDGGNVNGIRWEEAGGTFTASDIESVVEANAYCQWLRAARQGRQDDVVNAVLDSVPDWPGFRDQPDLDLVRLTIAEAKAGWGAEYDAAVADCTASRDREAAYSAKLNLAVSS